MGVSSCSPDGFLSLSSIRSTVSFGERQLSLHSCFSFLWLSRQHQTFPSQFLFECFHVGSILSQVSLSAPPSRSSLLSTEDWWCQILSSTRSSGRTRVTNKQAADADRDSSKPAHTHTHTHTHTPRLLSHTTLRTQVCGCG